MHFLGQGKLTVCLLREGGLAYRLSKVTIAKTPFVNTELMLNRIPDLLYKS